MDIYSGQAAIALARVKEEPFGESWRKLFSRRPDKLKDYGL